jgi:hypothetical protein
MNMIDIAEARIQMMAKQSEMRTRILKMCDTQAERDKRLDRWATEDAAHEIASAIMRAAVGSRRKLFGIF